MPVLTAGMIVNGATRSCLQGWVEFPLLWPCSIEWRFERVVGEPNALPQNQDSQAWNVGQELRSTFVFCQPMYSVNPITA